MRKALIVFLTVVLAVLLPAAPASAKHTRKKVNHVHFVRNGLDDQGRLTIVGRMWTGRTKRCKSAAAADVKVTAGAFSPATTNVSTDANGFFKGKWKMVGDAGSQMVRVRCRGVLFKGKFRIRETDLAYGGFPVLPTAAVGLGLTTIGWVMLLASGAGSDRGLRRLLIRRGAKRRSGGRAQGSDTAATRRP